MKNNPASALLLSFFMMTMLILVAISVSVLVLHDVRTVQTVVAGTQSYYAAEGMGELGLETVKNNLPGYEPSFAERPFSSGSTASMDMHAREPVVPCEGQGEDHWLSLAQNESVQLPLFAQTDAEGGKEEIRKFYVEFYVGDDEGKAVFPTPTDEVLRWKILGLQNANTEAISEYIPMDIGENRTSRFAPSIFGTSIKDAALTGYSYAKYYHTGYPSEFYPHYPIELFLSGHSYNYLVLSNVIQNGSAGKIYYRLVSEDYEAVCQYTELASESDTDLGSARRELVTLVKEGENLPVFDFVLYHTSNKPSIIP